MTEFTPLASTLGGAMIGLSAVLLMLGLGRIAGISGIVGGLLRAGEGVGWRAAFVAGLLLSAPLAALVAGGVEQAVPEGFGRMALAGLLVGFGAALGSGCTSGHGVCGLARLSGRSAAAVAVFMTAAFVTVFVHRHLIGG